MADRRKLQGEIERCLKKVGEGVEEFEDIWQKVLTAANATLKEKYEGDLKKEIKKLQRLRDQIKTWLTSSEIKDKSLLLDNRKLIETQMERFKAVEREMKTKAYSNEGLDGAQKVDPAQKEKEELTMWLSNCIEALGINVDQFESEMESLARGIKKNDYKDRVHELRDLLSGHHYHIIKLERIMRMLDNGAIEVSKIRDIKEDVEYYIECCQDPDFEENKFLYDDLNLQDMTDFSNKAVMGPSLEHAINGVLDKPATNVEVPPVADQSTSTIAISPVPESVPTGSTGPVVDPQGTDPASSGIKSTPSATSVVNRKPPVTITFLNKSASSQSNSANLPVTDCKEKHLAASPSLMPQVFAAAASDAVSPCASPPLVPPADGATEYESYFHWTLLESQQQHNSTNTKNTANALSQKPEHGESATCKESPSPSPVTALPYLPSVGSQDWPSLPPAPYHRDPLATQHNNSSTVTRNTANTVSQKPRYGEPVTCQKSPLPSSVTVLPYLSSVNSKDWPSLPPAPYHRDPLDTQHNNNSTVTRNTASTVSQKPRYGESVTCQESPSPSSATVLPYLSSGNSPSSATAFTYLPSSNSPSPATILPYPSSGNSPLPATVFPYLSSGSSPSSATVLPYLSSGNSPSSATNLPYLSLGNSASSPTALPYLSSTNSEDCPSLPTAPSLLRLNVPPVVKGGTYMPSNVTAQQALRSYGLEGALQPSLSPEQTLVNTLRQSSLQQMARPTQHHQMLPPCQGVVSKSMRQPSQEVGQPQSAGAREPPTASIRGLFPVGCSPLTKKCLYQQRLLEAASTRLPKPADFQRLIPRLERTPVNVPSYYPQGLPAGHTIEFFQKLEPETLFFVFYKTEGSLAQYLAAKALKKQSWRFHTKYSAWFQRETEPRIITDEFEVGTYKYFDYEYWGMGRIDGFIFEYKYLEEVDLN